MIFALAASAAFACASPAIHDGDNIRCAGGGAMRLAAIDAPDFESSPKCARRGAARAVCDDRLATASRDHLRRLVARGGVTCRVIDANARTPGFQASDRYGRPIVRCLAGVVDLSDAQVAAGHAGRWR